jgi:hypothetical protein
MDLPHSSPFDAPTRRRVDMSLWQLIGRASRLQRELAFANNQRPLNAAWVDRLDGELAATVQGIAALLVPDARPADSVRAGRSRPRSSSRGPQPSPSAAL